MPPGWRPHLAHYPFRRFLERVRLWYRQTDLDATQLGPALAARLQGRPFILAMALQLTTQAGVVIRGDEALAHAGEQAVTDPNTGAITSAATENGLQHLLRLLARWYGSDAQQVVGSAVDEFLDLRRGRASLLEYLVEHEYLLSEAAALGNFDLNPTGKSHFLLKYSGLDQAKQDHIKLLVDQDLSRYDEIYGHLERLAKSQQPSQLPIHPASQ